MDTLPQIVIERLRVQGRTFRAMPLPVIEDAGSDDQQLKRFRYLKGGPEIGCANER
jgi:hypothetical protein